MKTFAKVLLAASVAVVAVAALRGDPPVSMRPVASPSYAPKSGAQLKTPSVAAPVYAPVYAPRAAPVAPMAPLAAPVAPVAPLQAGLPTPEALVEIAKSVDLGSLRGSVAVTDEEQAKLATALDLLLSHDMSQWEYQDEIERTLGKERGEKYIQNAVQIGQKISAAVQQNTEGE